MSKRCFTCAIVLALASAVLGCSRAPTETKVAERPTVLTTRPVVRPVTEYVYFTGRMDAAQSVDIRARVTGYLVAVDFTSGTPVRKGQRLFQIDPRPYQAELDRQNAQVKLAQATYKQA